jgi:hypothetical protein
MMNSVVNGLVRSPSMQRTGILNGKTTSERVQTYIVTAVSVWQSQRSSSGCRSRRITVMSGSGICDMVITGGT